MAQAQVGTQSPTTTVTGVATVSGRLFSRRKVRARDGSVYVLSIIKTPAPDQYTSPGTLEVRSAKSLGEVGDEVTVEVRLSGYGRSYKATDPETGESLTIQTADNHLTVIGG